MTSSSEETELDLPPASETKDDPPMEEEEEVVIKKRSKKRKVPEEEEEEEEGEKKEEKKKEKPNRKPKSKKKDKPPATKTGYRIFCDETKTETKGQGLSKISAEWSQKWKLVPPHEKAVYHAKAAAYNKSIEWFKEHPELAVNEKAAKPEKTKGKKKPAVANRVRRVKPDLYWGAVEPPLVGPEEDDGAWA